MRAISAGNEFNPLRAANFWRSIITILKDAEFQVFFDLPLNDFGWEKKFFLLHQRVFSLNDDGGNTNI